MKLIFVFICFFIVFNFNNAHSTSTTFEQNLILNNKSNSALINPAESSSNFQSLAIASYIGILGKKLFDYGFFAPLDLLLEQIRSLSPLAYHSKTEFSQPLTFVNSCAKEFNNLDIYEEKKVIFKDFKKCNEFRKLKNISENKRLIDRYSNK